jgi:Amt family ammonium transporter
MSATELSALEAKVAAMQEMIDENTANITNNGDDMGMGWLVICGALVFFMQAGFGMLEAGAIGKKNVVNILFKNILDASGAAVCYWLIGYGLAFGDTVNGFCGNSNFGLRAFYNGAGGGGSASDGWEKWFFQWAFTGAAATIVAGSVAERCRIEAYFVYSIFISTFIYPIVVHWVWGQGFLSAWGARPDGDGNARPIFRYDERSNGMIDFAGSGVVHMVGGFSGLMGAIALGPRKGRFDPITGQTMSMPGHNAALMALGTGILWFGWYGFNCGSTLALASYGNLAAKVAVNTTLSAATACVAGTFITKTFEGHFDLGLALNSILAGLVGITAPCAVVDPWMAFLIGLTSACVYYLAHCLLLRAKIDDPLDAFPIHGCAGVWGCLCVGIFCTDKNVQYAAYPNVNNACGRGEQFGVQIVGVICIIGWTVVTAGLVFFGIKHTMGLRVSNEVEDVGMDVSEHGGGGYEDRDEKNPVQHVYAPAAVPAQAQIVQVADVAHQARNSVQQHPLPAASAGSPPAQYPGMPQITYPNMPPPHGYPGTYPGQPTFAQPMMPGRMF